MRIPLIILALFVIANCRGDETVAQYGGAGSEWYLTEIDKTPYKARATLIFGEDGAISGQAPCNSYSGTQTAPYPWFSVKDIAATRVACPDLAQEGAYLGALTEMTLSEVAGETLILSNDAGRELIFKASE